MTIPRYQVLATMMRKEIVDGRYKIGDHLPTELELCEIHRVSRFTAREAMRILRESGLVERRRGIGTIVIADQTLPAFEQAFQNVDDLLQYARDARLSVLSYTEHVARNGSGPLGIGKKYVEVIGLRVPSKGRRPVGLANIYLRPNLAPPERKIRSLGSAIMTYIEENSGVQIVRIEQTITSRSIAEREAHLLKTDAGLSALVIQRYYFDQSRTLLIASETVYPAGRFVYQQTIRRTADQPSQPK